MPGNFLSNGAHFHSNAVRFGQIRERMRAPLSHTNSRGGVLVRLGAGIATAVGAFLVSGMTTQATAPEAHADFEDLIGQPILDALGQATSVLDPGSAASIVPGIAVDGLAAPALAAAASPIAYIPLQEPATDLLVDISAGTGPSIPVIVDTGSSGLVVPFWDLPAGSLASAMLNPSDYVTGGYIGGPGGELDYWGVEVPTTVSIGDSGNQITTGPTDVIAALYTWDGAPQTWWEQFLHINHYVSMQDYFGPATGGSAVGVLGIGPNAPGPGPIVTAALPGELGQGELIGIYPDHQFMEFGSAENLDVGGGNLSSGAPQTDVLVQIDGGTKTPVEATFDSGGNYGDLPSSLVAPIQTVNGPNNTVELIPGTEISVYNTDGQLLYSYTTDANDSPDVTTDPTMNTGLAPFFFAQGNNHGVYIGNSGYLIAGG